MLGARSSFSAPKLLPSRTAVAAFEAPKLLPSGAGSPQQLLSTKAASKQCGAVRAGSLQRVLSTKLLPSGAGWQPVAALSTKKAASKRCGLAARNGL